MGERREKHRGRGLVVPDVRAVAVTAPAVVVGAFETVKLAVGRAERSCGDESGEIGAGSFLDNPGQRTFAKRGRKQARLLFETGQVGRGIFGSLPGALEALRIVIAD